MSTPRIAWMTDPHLNCLEDGHLEAFLADLGKLRADALLVGGDVGEAASIGAYLRDLAEAFPWPVYFVLGNHDFYGSSVADVRAEVTRLAEETDNLHYLTATGPVTLAPGIALIGHDGWSDARLGDFERSYVMLNDYLLVAELAGRRGAELKEALQALGDEAAAAVRRDLAAALADHEQVWFLTHVPPFREACTYEGRVADDDWAPHFTGHAVGEALRETMAAHPDRSLTVLCGHSHGEAHFQAAPNLEVHTGGATYGDPRVQRVFDLAPA